MEHVYGERDKSRFEADCNECTLNKKMVETFILSQPLYIAYLLNIKHDHHRYHYLMTHHHVLTTLKPLPFQMQHLHLQSIYHWQLA